MNTPQITQIIRRSDQGATRPFVCRADDGYVYFVKGHSASTGERIREWMGTHLAQAFGLPVPPMRLLEIPTTLFKSLDVETARDLGQGYAVGSRQASAVSELRHDEIPLIPADVQQAILLFDYWVQNEDRTLSALGGNPNLLLNKATSELFAIDYNQTTTGTRPARRYLEKLSPMKQAFHYNLIRFQPDVETGEFANIGVVVYAPDKHTLAFRLLDPQQHQRITQFFSPLDTNVFQGALELAKTELLRVQKLLPTVVNPTALHEELIRPREDIIRYALGGLILGEDAGASADELFRRYVQRELAEVA